MAGGAARRGSERFLDGEVEPVRPSLAPPVVGAQVRPRFLVEQKAEAESDAGREGVEEPVSRRVAVDRGRVEERDESEQSIPRERLAVLHLAVQKVIAPVAPLGV